MKHLPAARTSPFYVGCGSPAAVRPLAFGPVGFFLPGLACLESLTKRMEAAAARVKLKVAV